MHLLTNSTPSSLDTPVQFVKGVGPKRAAILAEAGIKTVRDLLYYLPRRHLDRTTITAIRDLKKDIVATVVAKVEAAGVRQARQRKYFQLIVSDGSGMMNCIWFNGIQYAQKSFTVGDQVAFHGKVEFYNGYQLVHPEYDKLGAEEREPLNTSAVISLYSSGQKLKSVGLDSRGFRRIMRAALHQFGGDIDDYLPENLRTELHLLKLDKSIEYIHFASDLEQLRKARYRLKFDEHFFLQLLMALRKVGIKEAQGRSLTKTGPYVKMIYEALDFELTAAQKKVLKEIRLDMASPQVMNRLLQGDVGSGKTIVAILAVAIAVGNSVQAAIMAPTEILAHQHYTVFRKHFDQVQITTALLVGNLSTKERHKILENLANGTIQVVVGTHALIQEDVQFADLGLAIIDEQHRFGVIQRGALVQKGLNPDTLVMTATPIPRTLAITYHGDLDLSVIDEMPDDRIPVTTRVVTADKIPSVYQFVRDQVAKGRQCMVVYPLVEESEKLDLKAAEEGYRFLAEKVYPKLRMALIHGRMKKEEKDTIMDAFSRNEIQILVSTTVIEVGIDVPNATVMLIENAERFGLTQLHQLRGRIGRGKEKGYCILIQRGTTATARRRLEIISRTTNGFEISDEDLKLRGPGEFYGARQHGFIRWKIADLVNDGPIIRKARQVAFDVVNHDPQLDKPEHAMIRSRFLEDYQHLLEFVNIS